MSGLYTRFPGGLMRLSVRSLLASLFAILTAALPAHAQEPDPLLAQNLKRLSIEELTQLDITTASRRIEPLHRQDQPQDPFLDQVLQRIAAAVIAACDLVDQPGMGLDQALRGDPITRLRTTNERGLLISTQAGAGRI